jgi:hypothetical protein
MGLTCKLTSPGACYENENENYKLQTPSMADLPYTFSSLPKRSLMVTNGVLIW